jgi:hypothetical protein
MTVSVVVTNLGEKRRLSLLPLWQFDHPLITCSDEFCARLVRLGVLRIVGSAEYVQVQIKLMCGRICHSALDTAYSILIPKRCVDDINLQTSF